jgi:hypothetical protein
MAGVVAAVEWSQSVENAWSDISEFVPKFVAFLLILLVGYAITKAIAKITDKALERVGFDRAVERGGIAKAMSKSQYDASDIVSKIVFYGLFLLVLQAAFGVFGPNPVSDLLTSVISYLPKLFVAVVIVVLASAIGAAVREIIKASIGGLGYGNALANAAGIVILGIGAFAALSQLEIAAPIVNGLFYAILATVVGVSVVAVGGSGIKPMQTRWESMLQRYDAEKPNMAREMQNARERVDLRAQQLRRSTQSDPSSFPGNRR